MKRCSRCRRLKSVDKFNKDKRLKDGLFSACKACELERGNLWRLANREKVAADARRYRKRHKARLKTLRKAWVIKNRQKIRRQKRASRIRLCGMTVQQYNDLLRSQRGRCFICRRKPTGRWKRLTVDHCHRTKLVRGLLCVACNLAVGYVHDSPKILSRLMGYLKRKPYPYVSNQPIRKWKW